MTEKLLFLKKQLEQFKIEQAVANEKKIELENELKAMGFTLFEELDAEIKRLDIEILEKDKQLKEQCIIIELEIQKLGV